MTAYVLGLTAVIGAVLGSFVNCLAGRLVSGEEISRGRSHCMDCGHKLAPWDLVPVVSWLFLKGRCRYCGAKISPRYLFTEVFMACLSMAFFLKFGLSLDYIKVMGFSCVLLATGLYDFDTCEIPDVFHVAALGWWVFFLIIQKDSFLSGLIHGFFDGFWVAAGLFLLTLISNKVAKEETMGAGDIELLFVTGVYLGWKVNLLNLIVSCILGMVFALVTKRREIPFGPFIGIATCFSMAAGSYVVERYIGFFG